MKETIIKRLISVKSLVTVVLTGVFAYLAVNGAVGQDFMTVYTVVIAFYFGTQAAQKDKGGGGNANDGK